MRKHTYKLSQRALRKTLATMTPRRLLGDSMTDFMEMAPLTAGQIAKISRGAK